jgi:predicted MPP superfamily phosphohydrolase
MIDIDNLKNINSSIKKYAITGNHDRKIEDWNLVIKESDFVDLNDNYDLIYKNSDKPILISGISTSSEQGNINHKLDKTNAYLASLKETDIKPVYSILLMHEPDFINDIDSNKFNLALAGHSHNGQLNIPILKNLGLPKYAREYYDAYYQVNNTKLYISSGLGTSTINARLFCKPSFNIYRLTNK